MESRDDEWVNANCRKERRKSVSKYVICCSPNETNGRFLEASDLYELLSAIWL